jgi:hypothetical protein
MKAALILTGQLRIKSEKQQKQWDSLKKEFKDYDVFISTYKDYEDVANQISNNIVYLEDETVHSGDYLELPPSNVVNDVNGLKGTPQMWQHIHLRNCVETFYDKLKNYRNIVRIRNDVEFRIADVINVIEQNPDKISLKTDWLFGCKGDLFLKMFYENNFVDHIRKMWNTDHAYVSLNYKNLNETLKKGGGYFRWDWFRYKDIDCARLNNIKQLAKANKRFQPTIEQMKIVPSAITVTGKPWDTAFSSEKQIAMYFLFFAPLAEIKASVIIR